ncbi:hypothetical protein HPC49_29375 [Pyxidicoccus fallax]|uniref:HEAT repeat domain-containing protein n=1 Tax=Pyxidicoccus fallax TaxID=394095 RepID=A0A848LIB1_9BACT|nr:hypothetical protein [Pyxidicoccus fallax]NMO17457.1 hypothetical protein [Pyxidicoccus fallax]NPC82318.1 hypothetical protein [Pyxidicoccus fallax]
MTPESVHRAASPVTGPRGGRVPFVLLGLGAVILLAGVALLVRDSGGGEGAAGADAPSAQARGRLGQGGAGGSSGGGGQQAEALPPRFDGTLCWKDLERFNEGVTVGNFRQWAAPLLASGDPVVRDYLRERLTELIGNDAAHATEVLGWARDAGPREFNVIMSALRASEAVHQPQVAARLLEQGVSGDLDGARRAGILSALDTQKRLDAESLGRLADFAKEPASGEAGWAATRTIARVMKRDFNEKGNLAPYLDKLLTIGTESPDEDIRYLALSMPMHATPVLDEDASARYAKVLTSEGSPDGREAAAHNLSVSGGDKARTLELFSQSFATEQEVCVRWALFRFAARVAGRDALPVMANMAVVDARFQPLYHVFERIYASGTLDFVRVWNSLPEQDPFGCLDRHH